ncbi:MAG: DUF5702 domain-containing protein [Lachnospiraceae bacterium]|nr:DUF5702 domain-containing protein [Lachnospiraceae bacterium]
MRRYRYRGEITVFLSLILSVLIILICALIESTRLEAIRYEIELNTDIAIRSCFAEYSQLLLNRYDLFYIDTSYRTGESDRDNLRQHLSDYVNVNLDTDGNKDLMALKLKDAEITEYMLASDMDGQVMMNQAVRYMKSSGTSVYRDIFIPGSSIFRLYGAGSFMKDWDECLSEIPSDNRVYALSQSIRSGAGNTGQLFMGSDIVLKELAYEDIPSERELERGIFPSGKCRSDVDDELFCDYLMQKLGCCTEYDEDQALTAELEYLIFGYKNDRDNLSSVINELLSLREGINRQLILSDETLLDQIASMTEDLPEEFFRDRSPDTLYPLIYAWAFAESAVEVNRLLCGGKCSINKSSSDWILPLYDLEDYKDHMGNGGGEGLSYKDHLGILLYNTSPSLKKRRFMDVVEADMRKAENDNFKIDGCVEYLEAKLYYESSFGYEKYIIRNHAYEETE